MLGFGMPEMIMIAVILGIVTVIIISKKGGSRQSDQVVSYSAAGSTTPDMQPPNHGQNSQPKQQNQYSERSMEIPGFGAYFLALFLTPIYCITRKFWLGFVVSTILYIAAGLTIMVFGLGFLFWMLAALPAVFKLRNEILVAHARRTGVETARAIAAVQRQEL